MWTDKPPKRVDNGIKCFTQEECEAYTKKVFRLKKQDRLSPCTNTYKEQGWHFQGKCPEDSYVVPLELFPELHDMGLKIQPLMERAVFKKLYPTYIYSRLYYPGYELCRHADRPSCEYSVSVTMGMGAYSCWYTCPSRQTSTSHHWDKKLTTVTPTPCKPPEV